MTNTNSRFLHFSAECKLKLIHPGVSSPTFALKTLTNLCPQCPPLPLIGTLQME